MDTSNIVAMILGGLGFIISITGFIVTPILNLKSKRLEKRLEYRFLLFQKILELWEYSHISSPNQDGFEPLMKEINKLIQLYGYNAEIKLFKKVVNNYNKLGAEQSEVNRQELLISFNRFLSIAFNAYRKEIVMDELVN